ncbi:MAG: diadenylate cyclase CdaA [Verrucomicrobiae bacterium]|nr:diadenylate cyclase CdaA [Verrucomicrobiae bacterium]
MMVELLQQSWRGVVEILLLSAAIYYALSFVRGTRAAPVVVGFLVSLFLVFALSAILGLSVLRWLVGAGAAFMAFATLVIFQPEIRRILARLGDLPMFGTARERRENIETIVQAAERLAEARIGALIAIEQSTHLDDAVSNLGVPIDCEATPEMFETIFFPNNAIHDGGVIVRNGRIAYAACIFPLTQRNDLRRLGTRHRAAIGLSEETDAVVVVVSEETGSISHAYKGHLQRRVGSGELRSFLSSIFVPRHNSSPSQPGRASWLPKSPPPAPQNPPPSE